MNLAEATVLATRALVSNGANPGPAASVARAVVAAQARGRDNVEFAHLPYYCEAYPDVGQWFLAMVPASGDAGTGQRIDDYLDRLEELGAHVPGRDRANRSARTEVEGIALPSDL